MSRNKKNWMLLSQEEINELTEENWEHYMGEGCLCSAHSDAECICGSWERMGK